MNGNGDFSYVITGYKDELRRNPKARLATYCRSLGVNDDRVHHWMEKHGLTVRGLKDEVLSPSQGIGNDFVPLSAEPPVAFKGFHRLELVFSNQLRLSAEHCSVQDLLTLLNGYHGGRE